MNEKERKELRDRYDNGPYPITIVLDRYGGAYSHAMWLAFNCTRDEIPECIDGFDADCMFYWEEMADKSEIGFGSTPDEAYEDLYKKWSEKRGEK